MYPYCFVIRAALYARSISTAYHKIATLNTTKETDVYVSLCLDGSGQCDISTGLGFFDHMLEQIGRHGSIDLTVKTRGDLCVDEHHTVEDTALALGECLRKALGDKRGTERHLAGAAEVFDEVEHSPVMQGLWTAYQKKFSYAADLSWSTVMAAVRQLFARCEDAV